MQPMEVPEQYRDVVGPRGLSVGWVWSGWVGPGMGREFFSVNWLGHGSEMSDLRKKRHFTGVGHNITDTIYVDTVSRES